MRKKESTSTTIFKLLLFFASPAALAHHYKVDGIYKMTVQIGDREFEDLVTLKEIGQHQLEGTVTVPGNFTAQLSGHYGKNPLCEFCDDKIEFQIEAVERGKKIRVLYTGTINPRSGADGIFFEGHAYDLDQPHSPPFGITSAVPLKALSLR